MTTETIKAYASSNTGGAASLQDYAVEIIKLTNAGINLRLSNSVHGSLGATDELMLSITLPANNRTYQVACIVHSRNPYEGAMLYSCEYDWSATMDPLGVIEDFHEYALDT